MASAKAWPTTPNPGTDTVKNRFGATNHDELERLEGSFAAGRLGNVKNMVGCLDQVRRFKFTPEIAGNRRY